MISVQGLRKEFDGFPVLKGLDMEVKTGEIYGFIGQNGVGKTTTMSILAGLSRPTRGTCVVRGKDVSKNTHPGDLGIGYLPEDPKFYPWMSARETLLYLSDAQNKGRVQEILRWTGLADASERRVCGFSRGMKQRLGIGVALIRDPDLFILDEPSSALDPRGRNEVLCLIKDLQKMGKTILLSTHILDDIERICDTVGMIDDGRMVFEKPLAQLQREYRQLSLQITSIMDISAAAIEKLSRLTGVRSVTKAEGSLTLGVSDKTVSLAVMALLVEHGVAVESFTWSKTRLEDLFLREVRDR
ncbi:MAG: ABC transporter ATP-binding protein [Bacillota bacterium]|jgi:ABC-2 type transport system ATP-binding protein|nr:ABC transporter ATP-binding protein [Bacillota bacterium]HHT91868.1 ABC transporter ATP-binding protein [Bacillota bacterium]